MTMAEPYDWSPGETVTAALMDAEIGDQFRETATYKAQAAGDLFVGTGAKALKRLALGSAGQLAKVNAAGNDVEWGNAPVAESQQQFVAATVSATTTTPTAKTGGPAVTVTVPDSGMVLIIASSQIYSSGSAVYGVVTVHDGTSVISDFAVTHQGAEPDVHEGSKLLTGLTPGASMTFTIYYHEEDGGTANFLNRQIIAIPL